MMKITYIGHSGFSVEFTSCVLLFDYYTGELPKWDVKKQIFIFVSHKHRDHFNLRIFELEKKYENIHFFLSSDIKLSEKYLERNRIAASVKEKITNVGKGRELRMKKTTDGGMCEMPLHAAADQGMCEASLHAAADHASDPSEMIKIRSLRSTDEGVAFIVTVEGKSVYHAGDLNWWRWEGEPGSFNADMEKAYKKEIDSIRGSHFDAAFVPLDPRLGESFSLGMDYFLTHVKADHVFPMHLWEEYEIIGKYKKTETGSRYRDSIADIQAPGQEFDLWNI